MTRSPERPSVRPATPGRRSWPARVIVLGPLAVAALATAFGTEPNVLAPLLLAAIAWTVLASLAGALVRGFRHGDWSSFRGHRFRDDGGELDEWASRTGRYEWLGDHEDRLRDDDRLH